MPGLQWLGVIPEEDEWSYIAQALKGGVEGYIKGRERAEQAKERALQRALQVGQYQLGRERLEEQKRQFEESLKRTDKENKMRALNYLRQISSLLTPSGREQLSQLPEVRALFKDVYGSEEVADSLKEIQTLEDIITQHPELGYTLGLTSQGRPRLMKEPTVTQQDIRELKKAVPWWEVLLPGTQTEAGRVYKEAVRKRREQIRRKLGGQPLTGKRGRRKSAEERFSELIRRGYSEDEAYRKLVEEGY